MIFTKQMIWRGKDAAGAEYVGEGANSPECYADAARQGSATCHIEMNPNFGKAAEEHADTPEPKVMDKLSEEERESIRKYVLEKEGDAKEAVQFAEKDALAWREKAVGLAELCLSSWHAIKVTGASVTEETPDPDFFRVAKAMLRSLMSPEEAAAFDAEKQKESQEALQA